MEIKTNIREKEFYKWAHHRMKTEQEYISEFENMSMPIEIIQLKYRKIRKKKKEKKTPENPRAVGQYQVVTENVIRVTED